MDVPLRVCVGAANALPEDPALDAFADRFLARIFVEPVADARLEELLETGWAGGRAGRVPPVTGLLLPVVDRLAAASRACDLTAIRPQLAVAVRRLRAAGVPLSDRRADLWVLPLIAPTADAQALARDTLADLLGMSSNRSLLHAAEELSRGPLARAERLADSGGALLADLGAPPHPRDERLRLEATLREIDASFAADSVPERLRTVRERLIAAVTPP
jgi:MoxR-like ATPase